MILSQKELRQAVERGEIQFDPPLEEEQWGEASVDLRLGFKVTRLKPAEGATFSVAKGLSTIAASGFWDTKELEREDELGHPESIFLKPNDFVLWLTYEIIKVPMNLIAMVQGRSTYARVGLSIHQTAPWIQPGWSGPIVLEIYNQSPITINLTPILDKPCQLTFFQLTSEITPEMTSRSYHGQEHPIVHPKKGSKK